MQAFMFQKNRMANIGARPDGGASISTAFGINDAGEIVGVIDERPFVIHDGVTEQIELAAGLVRGEARAINRKGQIAGTSFTAERSARAFLRDFGVSQDLRPLPGDVATEARAINVNGDVVGRSGSADLSTSRAVLWRQGVAIDLDTQTDADGWTLLIATGINDVGQIVGTGLHNGQKRAFRLHP
jgi:probable HAF family extracellular repeat protein